MPHPTRFSRRDFLRGAASASLALGSVSALAADAPMRPNILIIFTDDQGYADFGCFGSTTHKTPRMDELAAQGTKYTSFYAQNVCGPSRSALLTGRYPVPPNLVVLHERNRCSVRALANQEYQICEPL